MEEERHRGDRLFSQKEDLTDRAELDDAVADVQNELGNNESDDGQSTSRKSGEEDEEDHASSSFRFCKDEGNLRFKVKPLDRTRVVFKTYASLEGEQVQLFLEDLRPLCVFLYYSKASFIRLLELYSMWVSVPSNNS